MERETEREKDRERERKTERERGLIKIFTFIKEYRNITDTNGR